MYHREPVQLRINKLVSRMFIAQWAKAAKVSSDMIADDAYNELINELKSLDPSHEILSMQEYDKQAHGEWLRRQCLGII